MGKKCHVQRLGRIAYQEAYRCQRRLLSKRARGEIPDQLLLVEHHPVITIGRGGSRDNLLAASRELERKGITLLEIDRGGDITYHGPGQLVGYPILALSDHRKDLHWLLRRYEEVFIRLLADYGLFGERIPGLTGVWIEGEKILAIGVGVKKWVTFHGFAFNIRPELSHFELIVPCGISDRGVTSLRRLLGDRCPDLGEVQERVIAHFGDVFGLEMSAGESVTWGRLS